MKLFIVAITVSCFFFACNDKKTEKQLKLGAATSAEQQTPLEESMERGGLIYTDFCMQCHLANGKGIPGNFPPLANSNWLTEKRTESIHAVKFGQQGEIMVNGKPYDGVMAPMGLSDTEVADVLNYVMNHWGNEQNKMVTPEEVAAVEE
ncbi:MAG: cytochrome c [Marinirhabdus sp.]|nr:cytochrome c [Marinirhabdus sp.]